MTELPRAEVLRILRRAGRPDTADELASLLPDPVDLDREAGLLERHGLSRDVLIDRMGGSP